MVQIPAGTAPNAIIQVRAPDGRTLNVRVPRNLRPGQQMRISVPAAAPKATKPASEAQERDARRQRREEAAREREDATARREAVERSRREASEERERHAAVERSRREAERARAELRAARDEAARREAARARERDEAARREAARARESAAGERPNSVRLRDVHDRLSTDAISSWGGEIEGATGLTCQWHDQGWGNRKGMVYARTTGGTPYYGTWQPLSGNEAPHAITRLGVQLPSSLRRRRIQFGYRVGGGGGHEIHIEQAVVNVQGGTAPAPARPTGNAAARERPSYNAAFAVNQRVEVRCRGGDQWFTGKITAVRDGCWYDIIYDDGESEARVAVSRIRRWVSTPHTGAPASARPMERGRADAARDEVARRERARAASSPPRPVRLPTNDLSGCYWSPFDFRASQPLMAIYVVCRQNDDRIQTCANGPCYLNTACTEFTRVGNSNLFRVREGGFNYPHYQLAFKAGPCSDGCCAMLSESFAPGGASSDGVPFYKCI